MMSKDPPRVLCFLCDNYIRIYRHVFQDHLRRAHLFYTPYACPRCTEKFATEGCYDKHAVTVHGIDDQCVYNGVREIELVEQKANKICTYLSSKIPVFDSLNAEQVDKLEEWCITATDSLEKLLNEFAEKIIQHGQQSTVDNGQIFLMKMKNFMPKDAYDKFLEIGDLHPAVVPSSSHSGSHSGLALEEDKQDSRPICSTNTNTPAMPSKQPTIVADPQNERTNPGTSGTKDKKTLTFEEVVDLCSSSGSSEPCDSPRREEEPVTGQGAAVTECNHLPTQSNQRAAMNRKREASTSNDHELSQKRSLSESKNTTRADQLPISNVKREEEGPTTSVAVADRHDNHESLGELSEDDLQALEVSKTCNWCGEVVMFDDRQRHVYDRHYVDGPLRLTYCCLHCSDQRVSSEPMILHLRGMHEGHFEYGEPVEGRDYVFGAQVFDRAVLQPQFQVLFQKRCFGKRSNAKMQLCLQCPARQRRGFTADENDLAYTMQTAVHLFRHYHQALLNSLSTHWCSICGLMGNRREVGEHVKTRHVGTECEDALQEVIVDRITAEKKMMEYFMENGCIVEVMKAYMIPEESIEEMKS